MNERGPVFMNTCPIGAPDSPTVRVRQTPETFSSLKPFILSSSHHCFTKLELPTVSGTPFIFPPYCNLALMFRPGFGPKRLKRSHSAAGSKGRPWHRPCLVSGQTPSQVQGEAAPQGDP